MRMTANLQGHADDRKMFMRLHRKQKYLYADDRMRVYRKRWSTTCGYIPQKMRCSLYIYIYIYISICMAKDAIYRCGWPQTCRAMRMTARCSCGCTANKNIYMRMTACECTAKDDRPHAVIYRKRWDALSLSLSLYIYIYMHGKRCSFVVSFVVFVTFCNFCNFL